MQYPLRAQFLIGMFCFWYWPMIVSPLSANESKVVFENSLGQQFVRVDNTTVLFCIWETRVRDYEAFTLDSGRKRESAEFVQGATHPAVMVSWEDAALFCSWLTKREVTVGKIPAGCVYRLPRSEEWSLAVGLVQKPKDPLKFSEGPSQTDFPWGGPWPPGEKVANYHPDLGADSYANTSPVGTFLPNRFGIYDLGGNVWEWCQDSYKNSIDFRVLRGASWRMRSPGDLLSSIEIGNVSHIRLSTYGFRVVLEVPDGIEVKGLKPPFSASGTTVEK
jgi:formylglycine-generating enzyme required for sulfatase activity